jgi:glucose-6-phosphate 1-dehydrogenase
MKQSSTIFVIFGITGDLAHKKLLPALFELYTSDNLAENFQIIGFSRKDLSVGHRDNDDGVRALVRDVLDEHKKYKKKDIKAFSAHVHYEQGDFTNVEDMIELGEHLGRIESRSKICTNRLLYLAVPPKYYDVLFTNIYKTKLCTPCSADAWARILVEKPFGRDLVTAEKLDRQLSRLFREDQIFRIDHYLEKEMIQNILTFRFTNSLFEPIWNHEHIERIEVLFEEELDASERGAFYDGVGALRDVGQNHMLQMLALSTMERPKSLQPDDIRTERAMLLSSLTVPTKKTMSSCIRGQYTGFTRTKGVKKGSTTETFFQVKGVPIILRAGKALGTTRNEVRIYFKHLPQSLCPEDGICPLGNVVRFTMRPTKEIGISFVSKVPGLMYELETEELIFDLKKSHEHSIPDAYQKVLYDAMHGDQTLFTSSQEVDAAWRFTMPILRAFGSGTVPLTKYKRGSDVESIT